MRTYEKIETLYSRDILGTKNLIEGEFRNPTVEMLKDIEWLWSEKVDGTNIRVEWNGSYVTFGGRTDKANIPAELVNRLNNLFNTSDAEEMFEQLFGDKNVILFGEGYGRKIQNGGSYIPDGVDFILFDVLIGDNYLPQPAVWDIAKAFGIKHVPTVGYGTLEKAVEYVKSHPSSMLGSCEMEGIVCRPAHELRDRAGNRIIVKIKWNDFKPLVEKE